MNRGGLATLAFALLALPFSSGPAGAAEPILSVRQLYEQGQLTLLPGWLPLGTDYRSAAFVQRDPARPDGHLVATWVDLELAVPEYHEKEHAYRSIRERLLLDCKGRRAAVATTALYAEHFGRGAVIDVAREESPPMRDAIPESIEDMLLRHACPAPTAARRTVHRAPAHKK